MPCPRLAPVLASLVLLACGPGTDPMSEDTGDPSGDPTGDPPAETSASEPTGGPTQTSATSSMPPETGVGETTADDSGTAPTTLTSASSEPTSTSLDTSTTTPPDSDSDSDSETTADVDSELCSHAGGPLGVTLLTSLFLGRVATDARVNAYFLRSDLDLASLGGCVSDQLAEAFGCAGVTYNCKDMVTAHQGLGISTVDFTDFAEDFGLAWDDHKAQSAPDLTDAEKTAVLDALAAMAPEIVEDPDNSATVYQRVGRKPAIQTVIGDLDTQDTFLANVGSNPAINGFFIGADPVRLATCLVRQVHSIDGPKTYGLEIDSLAPDVDPGVAQDSPCRDMQEAHAGLVNPNNGNTAIEFVDFTELVGDLVDAMTSAGVAMADQSAILAAFGPLCPVIVAVDPEKCPP
jgi:hypothetical protein